MRMIAGYLERAINFEKMAAAENDATLKAQLLDQAAAYRKLAVERVARLPTPGNSPTRA